MWLLLNWRLVVLALALAAYPVIYLKGRHDGIKVHEQIAAGLVAQANIESRKNEQLRQDRVDEAARLAAARQRSILAASANARTERDGLLHDLDAVQRASAQSLAAANDAFRVTAGLLDRCTVEYLRMAENAARADSEARALRQAWPTK